MRIRYTESFPKDAVDVDGTLRMIRKIVEDRLATEILKKLPKDNHSEIA